MSGINKNSKKLTVEDISPDYVELAQKAAKSTTDDYKDVLEFMKLQFKNKGDEYIKELLRSDYVIGELLNTYNPYTAYLASQAITGKLEVSGAAIFDFFEKTENKNNALYQIVQIIKNKAINNENKLNQLIEIMRVDDPMLKNQNSAQAKSESPSHSNKQENSPTIIDLESSSLANKEQKKEENDIGNDVVQEIEHQVTDIHNTMNQYIDFLCNINKIEVNDLFLKQQIDASTIKLKEFQHSVTQHLANKDAHSNEEDIITIELQPGNKDPLNQLPLSLLALASKIINEANTLQNIVNNHQNTIMLKQENAALTEQNAILANQNEELARKLEAFSKKNVYFADVLYAKLTQFVDFIKSIASKIFGTTIKTSAENTETTIQQPSEIKAEESKPKGMPVQKVTLNWSNFKETIKKSTETMDRLHNIINEFKNKSPEI